MNRRTVSLIQRAFGGRNTRTDGQAEGRKRMTLWAGWLAVSARSDTASQPEGRGKRAVGHYLDLPSHPRKQRLGMGKRKVSRPTQPNCMQRESLEGAFPAGGQAPKVRVLTRWPPRVQLGPWGSLGGTFDGRKVPQVIGVGPPVPLFASHCQCFLPPPQKLRLCDAFREI